MRRMRGKRHQAVLGWLRRRNRRQAREQSGERGVVKWMAPGREGVRDCRHDRRAKRGYAVGGGGEQREEGDDRL